MKKTVAHILRTLILTDIRKYLSICSALVRVNPKHVILYVTRLIYGGGYKDFSGKLKNPVPEFSPRTNIWKCVTSFNDKTEHPAPMPEQLALDHIKTWTNENDIVLDPFMGSGTTGKMAILANRKFIGIEISADYCEMARKRIEKYNEARLF